MAIFVKCADRLNTDNLQTVLHAKFKGKKENARTNVTLEMPMLLVLSHVGCIHCHANSTDRTTNMTSSTLFSVTLIRYPQFSYVDHKMSLQLKHTTLDCYARFRVGGLFPVTALRSRSVLCPLQCLKRLK